LSQLLPVCGNYFDKFGRLRAGRPVAMEPELMRSRLADSPVGRLATVRPSGTPHLVPCCFVLAGDTIYSAVDGKPKTTTALRRLDNLRANPRAALLVDHYADDWSTLWWVRADGHGRVLDAGAERDQAIDLLIDKYDQYRTVALDGPMIALDITHWQAWP
jgi:PPOX class probable F420-dependent enzyme